jgi:hypothetical protein
MIFPSGTKIFSNFLLCRDEHAPLYNLRCRVRPEMRQRLWMLAALKSSR